jgi:hypothetical protein
MLEYTFWFLSQSISTRPRNLKLRLTRRGRRLVHYPHHAGGRPATAPPRPNECGSKPTAERPSSDEGEGPKPQNARELHGAG